MSEGTKWREKLGEAVVIVASILLAFWIDAWWVGREEARNERESLELVSRDLNAAIAQLTDFAEFAEQVGTEGLEAMEALSTGDVQEPLELSRMIQRASDRKTVALPTAAYTDLVSTGTLRLVRNRDLRDAIVRFYESAEIAQRILEKNSSLFLDGHIYSFYADGLLIWRVDEPWGHREAQVVATEKASSRLSEDFEYTPDYFWSLPTNSPEWHRLRSSLSVTAHTLFMGREYALEVIEDARTLDAEVRRELEARGVVP
ncbi:MAG: hypothetical protein OEZ65_09865 [Gemmatimonadota bacterium]|nr:hypothetical protein [Gemmatimonadota bacterium]